MKGLYHSILILLIFSFGNELLGQCSTGTEPECQCNTAPVLCTIDSLDGYQFSMDPFLHPGDAPSPLCSGPFCSCTPHNPTWFAFTAWCTELDLNVEFDNCQQVGASIGAQIAIYADCDNFTEVDCNVSAADCNTNDKMLNLTGLDIGGTYYFLIDGCSGSYCDVTIDVIGTCGLPEIEDWTNGVTGETTVCAGDNESYTVDDLDGANTYHWYVDGTEIGTTENPINNIAWPTPGVYELCVDASQDPCVPVTDPPDPICITVTVYEPNAGMITATPNPLCPGETSDITITGENTNPDLSQYLIIVDPNNIVTDVINGTTASLTYGECGTFTAYSYNFITADNPTLPVVGNAFPGIDCSANCCDLEAVDIIFEDTETPVFLNEPPDETVECIDLIPPVVDLEVQDNCLPNAFVIPTESGSPDLCGGGVVSRTWEFTDSCGNLATYTQEVTVDPIAEAAFDNPPADITVDCNNIPLSFPDLDYDNNATNSSCRIMGSVSPVINGTLDYCGSTVTVTWSFTDTCGRTISHDQTITITPPSEPAFDNPPADITVTCENIPTTATPDLTYTNGESGNCEISGSVSATVTDNADECGGTITNTWEYTDTCMRTISHTQTITVDPASEASFVNPPADTIVDCDALPLPSPPDLMYTNGEIGLCNISGSVSPTTNGTPDECGGSVSYTWEFTDNCMRTISHTQTITINPIPQAMFVNPPADTSVDCDALPLPPPPDLEYTNSESGTCEISGFVSATIGGNPDECGGNITYTWEYTDQCSRVITHTQNIFVNPAPQPSFVNPPGPVTLSCEQVETGGVPDLNYTNNESGVCEISGTVSGVIIGNLDYCGGDITYEWEFIDDCNRIINHTQVVSVEPAPEASFSTSPPDITISCTEANNLSIPNLTYDNGLSGNCRIQGTITGTQQGTYNACGGNLTHSWEYTDICGRTITEERQVTVNPAPQVSWINPPPDITINCDEVAGISNELEFDNSAPLFCNTAGTAQGVITGTYDGCGGMLNQEWSFVSNCGYTITHARTITVNPAPSPEFVNPPADITLDCGETFPPPQDLEYTNGESGDCEIRGTSTPTVSSSGNFATYTWEFTDPCSGNQITHIQELYLTPSPDLTVDPGMETVCEGSVYDLGQLTITDFSGTNPDFTFYDNLPFSPANEITDLNYMVNGAVTIYIVGTIPGGCADTVEFNLTTELPPNAGEDGSGQVCDNSTDVPLNSFLSPPYDNNGNWVSLPAGLIDISDPNAVNFNGVPPGDYTFYYIVPGTIICDPDTAEIIISVQERPYITIISVECSPDFSSYTVVLEVSNNGVIYPSAGMLDQSGGIFTITDIPIDEDLVIDASLPDGTCFTSTSISAPDCNCPMVPLPQVPPITEICEGDSVPSLSVTIDNDYSVNWYDQQTGGMLLAGNTLTYTPSVTGPGVYSFYVESYSLHDSCLSSSRAEVQLEVNALPEANSIDITTCGDNGFATFDLESYVDMINGGQGSDVEFYLTLEDAESESNALILPFENTVPDMQTLYIRVTSANNCFVVDSVLLFVNERPEIDLQTTDESCLGAEDGHVLINGSSGQMPYDYYLDGQLLTEAEADSLVPGFYEVEITDANDCSANDTFQILQGQDIEYDIISLNCNDNGTSTDSTDDYYILTLIVNSTLGGNYTFDSPDTNLQDLSYGDTLQINIATTSGTYPFTLTDSEAACIAEGEVTNLGHCSSDCSLQIEDLIYSCNGNGTPTDPSDDYYEVLLIVNGINTGSNGQYSVRVDGTLVDLFNYGDSVSFTLPADGSSPLLNISDSQITACRTSESIGPLEPCSDQCEVYTEILSLNCDDNGTQNDDTDDIYTATVVISGVNNGMNGWETDNGLNGNFGDTVTLGPYLISDGDQEIVFSDVDKTNCTQSLTIEAPPPCSQVCELEVFYEILECNNNMTGNDPSDDYYTIRLVVTVVEGPVTQYSVTDTAMNTYGPFSYGDTVLLQNIPANGNSWLFEIVDGVASQCIASFSTMLEPCSECTGEVTGGPNAVLSCDQSTVLLTATAMNANSISWSGPNGFSGTGDQVEVDAPGEYIVTAFFDDNCTDSDTVIVDVDTDIPVAVAGPDGLINCTVDSFILRDNSNNTNPNIIREWTDENGDLISTNEQYTVRDSGSYFLRLIDTVNQCSSAVDRVVVGKNLHQPDAVIYADPDSTFDCQVMTITLSTDIEENTIYFWSSGDQSFRGPSITINNPNDFELIALDTISTCSDTANITIEDFSEYPSISIMPPGVLTCANTEILLDASGSYFSDSIQYRWQDAQENVLATDTSVIQVSEPGLYIFSSEDVSNGCVNTDSVEVLIDTSSLDLRIEGQTTLPCGVDSTSLTVVETGGQIFENIQWTTDTGELITDILLENVIVKGSGNYTVSAVHPGSGCESQTSVFVDASGSLQITALLIDSIICEGDFGAIEVQSINGSPPIDLRLNNDPIQIGQRVSGLTPGNYTITAEDTNGCMAKREIIFQQGRSVSIDIDPFIRLSRGDTALLDALVNLSQNEIDTVIWQPADNLSCAFCLKTVITAVEEQQYQITVTDIHGCMGMADFRLYIFEPAIQIFIPNAITPNGDGINEGFTLYSDEDIHIDRLHIYDRWGNMMFETRDIPANLPELGWDGTFKSQPMKPGVYVYVIEFTLPDGEKRVRSGDVSILK